MREDMFFLRASSSFLNAYPGPSFARVENFQEAKGGGRRRGRTNRMEGRWQALVLKIGMQQQEGLTAQPWQDKKSGWYVMGYITVRMRARLQGEGK